jgi:hypothetical protein
MPMPATRLASLPLRPVGISLPGPIDSRLDQLWLMVRTAGQPATRQEIVAALVLESPETPDALVSLLSRYRAAGVTDPLLGAAKWKPAEAAAPKRPGRRKLEEGRSGDRPAARVPPKASE